MTIVYLVLQALVINRNMPAKVNNRCQNHHQERASNCAEFGFEDQVCSQQKQEMQEKQVIALNEYLDHQNARQACLYPLISR